MTRMIHNPSKVLFLDRDGVINRDSVDYIKSWAEFEFLPGSLQAMAMLTRENYHLIVVTNQSIVGRGMVTLAVLEQTHRRMQAVVTAAGGHIEAVFYCPHRPDQRCACRKPRPGLIHQAQQRFGIDVPSSIMIGDSAKDIHCGRNAGCGFTVLVRTGNGAAAEGELAAAGVRPDAVVDDLLAAAHLLAAHPGPPGNG